jgi:uncharacterized iron-regulated membrane protein
MSASAYRYSCDELAACQSRPTPCAGCQHPFAPGAITRHQRRRLSQLGSPAQRLELKRWLLLAAVLAALAITLGLAAGLATGA